MSFVHFCNLPLIDFILIVSNSIGLVIFFFTDDLHFNLSKDKVYVFKSEYKVGKFCRKKNSKLN